ncbi:ribonuclease HII [Pseudoramibacter sp.]|jgi:ribonuclease HII|uniref:ribonuclease HII n=1 Tax=Pseudoramibacter sp. TaxID=2034862 RepID=UPI0025E395E1|nr:ribonuclease HII [Pseudoramibacter sp.]MCH4072801.1 ribonuclease HII [Pseudoramibacter sp.]MCH4106572.1 ribonuclease HII [Pseudoramibacter sp.]
MRTNITEKQLSQMTIPQIKKLFEQLGNQDKNQLTKLLKADPRKGIKDLINREEKKALARQRSIQTICIKKKNENIFHAKGYKIIAGMDEVGRGPLAGPVVVAAVILPEDSWIIGIDDSKKISEEKRETLAQVIKKEAVSIGIAQIGPQTIDQINIYNSTKLAMYNAVKNLSLSPELLLIDAVNLDINIASKSIIHGDEKCYSIGAASIVAKVYRDHLMKKYAKLYPQYAFEKNKGYGTAEHIQAICHCGLTPIHRRSFVQKIINKK